MRKFFNKEYLGQLERNVPFSCKVQTLLQFFGIAIHNPFRDECCFDFECCKKKKDKSKCWLHINRDKLPFNKITTYVPTKPKGEIGRRFIKHSKWAFKF